MKISAVIFDLDGTVLDDEDEYGAAFAKVLKSVGVDTDEEYPQIGGIGVKENWIEFKNRYKFKTKKSITELVQDTQDAYLEQIHKIKTKPGFEKFIQDLRDSGILTALATSNNWWIVEKVFDELDLQKYFDVVTTAEEVAFKKPDPDLFLTTAEKLNVEPEECLVFEDAASGIAAAHAAGMKVIALARDKKHAQTLKDADLVIYSYAELSPEVLINL